MAEGFLAKPLPAVSNFIAPRRQALAAMGAGLASGRNFGEGVAAGLRALPGAMQADAEVQRTEQAEAERQAEIKRQEGLRAKYSTFFREKGENDFASLVEDGVMAPGEAYGAYKSGMKASELIKVGAGETLVDPATRQPVYTGPAKPLDEKERFDRETTINSQYTAADPVKNYNTVRTGYQKVRDAARLDTGAGDVSLIFAYMKMLDPTSVVREGEFATAQQTAGIPQTVVNLYNQAISGTRLNPQQRQEFIGSADEIYDSTVSNLEGLNKQYTGRAQAWDVNPENFILMPQMFEPWEPGASPAVPTDIDDLVNKWTTQ